jgi:FemAB-related protein (PEP-CTERM system-associated)
MSEKGAGGWIEDGSGLDVVDFEGSAAEWDALLSGFQGTSFCHLGGWRRIMTDVLGHAAHYRVALDGEGTVRGLLPMVRVKSRLFGDYLLSMPFLSYGGPVGTPGAREALASDAASAAESMGVDLMELRARESLPGELEVSDRKITVLLELPQTVEELWEKGLKAKVRSQVRRPMKAGMEARTGQDLTAPFYSVFSRTMRDLGTPVLPRKFFEEIALSFPGQVLFCTVELGDEPVAAGCGFLWEGEFEITWAGSSRTHSKMAPNMLLYWTLMEETVARGGHTFNFGRCTPGSGTHRFKRQWGGRDQDLPWAQWRSGTVSATPAPTGRRYEVATSLWRKLPLSLANRIGPMISRNLP